MKPNLSVESLAGALAILGTSVLLGCAGQPHQPAASPVNAKEVQVDRHEPAVAEHETTPAPEMTPTTPAVAESPAPAPAAMASTESPKTPAPTMAAKPVTKPKPRVQPKAPKTGDTGCSDCPGCCGSAMPKKKK